jgi:hypothetical protein
MAFKSGDAARSFLTARGLGGKLSDATAIRQANSAQRYEAAGVAYTKSMLRAHFASPEHPGRATQAARNVIPGMTARQQVRALPKGVQRHANNTMSADGIRRVQQAETALRAFVREGTRYGGKMPRVQILIKDDQGNTVTLGSKYGYSAGYIQDLIDVARDEGERRIWQAAIFSLLAGGAGYGINPSTLNFNTIRLVSV